MTYDQINWGIIGTGDVAEHKGGPPLYNVPNSHLVAVMSRQQSKVRSFAERHGVSRIYTDAQALIDDPEVNAVYIATPPHVHRDLSERAAAAGKHVLLEKPMAPTVADCNAIVDACKKHDVQLIVAFYRRFFPVVRKMKELLDGGAIGRPIRARAFHAWQYSPEAIEGRGWLTNPDVAGGGFMMDSGIHRLDLFAYFFGPAQDVSAYTDTVHIDIPVDDTSTVIIRFENGVHATAEFNWNLAIGMDEFEISGTEGRLFSRNLGAGELTLVNKAGSQSFILPPPEYTHLNLVDHFVQCLRAGTPNELPGEEGMRASQLCLAAYEASRGRAFVKV